MSADKAKVITANIKFAPAKDLPLLHAHQIVVNFTGTEFYATVYVTAPEPWTGEGPNPDIEARPVARFAFAPSFWLAFVQSAADQASKLEEQGAISPELREQIARLLGT